MEQVNPSVYASADAEQKKERKKIIIISIITILFILILLVAVIVAATNRSKNEVAGGEISIDASGEIIDTKNKEEVKTEDSANKKEGGKSEAKAETKTSDTTSTIAKTGPEDFIPLALLGGSLTTFLTSLYLSKKSA